MLFELLQSKFGPGQTLLEFLSVEELQNLCLLNRAFVALASNKEGPIYPILKRKKEECLHLFNPQQKIEKLDKILFDELHSEIVYKQALKKPFVEAHEYLYGFSKAYRKFLKKPKRTSWLDQIGLELRIRYQQQHQNNDIKISVNFQESFIYYNSRNHPCIQDRIEKNLFQMTYKPNTLSSAYIQTRDLFDHAEFRINIAIVMQILVRFHVFPESILNRNEPEQKYIFIQSIKNDT